MSPRKSSQVRSFYSFSIRSFFGTLKGDAIVVSSIKYSVVFFVIYLLLIGVFSLRLPPEIPLYYSKPWGAEQLSSSTFLFVLLGFAVLLFLFNSILSAYLLLKEKILSYVLMWTATLFIFLVDITVGRIIMLVF